MNPPPGVEESGPPRRSYSPADAAADDALYLDLKRRSSVLTAYAVGITAACLAAWYPWPAISLAVGGVCGIANAQLTLRGSERLAQRRNVRAFVLSSFGRVCLFGIVPVVLALRAPSLWTLGCYFAGFFTPLAVYGTSLRRAYRKRN